MLQFKEETLCLDPTNRGSKLLYKELSEDDICKFLAVSGVPLVVLISLFKDLFKARRLGLVDSELRKERTEAASSVAMIESGTYF